MNLVFDLGGVVITWRPETLIADVFKSAREREKIRAGLFAHPDWLEFDRGRYTPEEMIGIGTARTGLPRGKIAEMIYGIPEHLKPVPESVDLLKRLKNKGYPLYCLSNMPECHYEYLRKTTSFFPLFNGKVISCQIGRVKPEPEIYAHLLKAFSLNPSETVFIDDMAINLTAAEAFGIRTLLFKDARQCERHIEKNREKSIDGPPSF